MGLDVNKQIPEEVETKYSNLDVEFEQKVKTLKGIEVQDDDEDLFIITEDKEEENLKPKQQFQEKSIKTSNKQQSP